jgi:hypothetical protein
VPNKIYIEYNEYEQERISRTTDINIIKSGASLTTKVLELPLLEDVKIDAQSKFTTWNEMLPPIVENTINLVSNWQAGIEGAISSGVLNLKNKFDLPKWNSTDPIEINVTLGFFTKTDSYNDVTLPVRQIIGLSILSKDPSNENMYQVPGISLNTMKEFSIQIEKGNKSPTIAGLKAKIISLEIPGIIYIPLAYVKMAMPTYSKQITESGLPLWCSLDCQFASVSPATTDAYKDAVSSTRSTMNRLNFSAAKSASKILG